jgi:hypothetical protein
MKHTQPDTFRRVRTALGFAIAPLVPAVLIALLSILHGDHNAMSHIVYCAKVGYPAVLLLGVPGYLLLRRFGWNGLPAYVLLGGLIGIAIYIYVFATGVALFSPGVMYAVVARMLFLPLAVIFGIMAFVALWLTARPDDH